jgi:hypothetical protein
MHELGMILALWCCAHSFDGTKVEINNDFITKYVSSENLKAIKK